MKRYEICWGGSAFGDRLLAGWVCNILNFNGVNCSFNQLGEILNCKDFYNKRDFNETIKTPLNRTKKTNPDYTILTDLLYCFLQQSKENLTIDQIDIKNAPHPIIYKDIPEIKGVDVSIVSESGGWTPYRNWPYFDDLKKLLAKNNILYIDLSEKKVKNFEFLNYVKKSKIYLGLETGSSHYAAPFIKDNAFIIQSGYCSFDYWAAHYNFIKIENKMQCAPCWKRSNCVYNHECMTQISAEKVFKKIKEKL